MIKIQNKQKKRKKKLINSSTTAIQTLIDNFEMDFFFTKHRVLSYILTKLKMKQKNLKFTKKRDQKFCKKNET